MPITELRLRHLKSVGTALSYTNFKTVPCFPKSRFEAILGINFNIKSNALQQYKL